MEVARLSTDSRVGERLNIEKNAEVGGVYDPIINALRRIFARDDPVRRAPLSRASRTKRITRWTSAPGKDSALSIGDFLRSYLLAGGQHYSASGSFSASAPGTTYDYCNVGFGLLGYLGSRVAGMDLRVFTRERLFARLGMRHVSWTLADVPPALRATPYDVVDGRLSAVKPVGFPDWSAGMLRASIADFMRFVAASSNGGAANGVRMIGASTQALMLDMQIPSGLPAWLTGQGLGWMASREGGTSRINHWGGDPGVFTAAYLDPTRRVGVAIFANISATDASKTAIKAIAARLLNAGDPR